MRTTTGNPKTYQVWKMIYNDLDMYDTDLKKAFPYGNHKWVLLPNSTEIQVVKCSKCKIARLFLVGHDLINCK